MIVGKFFHLRRDKANAFRHGVPNDQGNPFYRVTATGRSRCRQCGKKIAAGERCYSGEYDFSGSGTWTSSKCYLHDQDCGYDCGYDFESPPLRMCPETHRPHRYTWNEEYDGGDASNPTYNCKDCGEPAPEGWTP